MKKYMNIIITLLLILLQVTILNRIKIFGINYNMALVSVIIVSALSENKIAIINSIIAGILYDIFACYNVGWHLVMFLIITVFMSLMVKYMYQGSMITVAILTAIFTIITELILYNFGYAAPQNCGSFAFLRFILPQTIINTLLSVILFPLFKKINKSKNKYNY